MSTHTHTHHPNQCQCVNTHTPTTVGRTHYNILFCISIFSLDDRHANGNGRVLFSAFFLQDPLHFKIDQRPHEMTKATGQNTAARAQSRARRTAVTPHRPAPPKPATVSPTIQGLGGRHSAARAETRARRTAFVHEKPTCAKPAQVKAPIDGLGGRHMAARAEERARRKTAPKPAQPSPVQARSSPSRRPQDPKAPKDSKDPKDPKDPKDGGQHTTKRALLGLGTAKIRPPWRFHYPKSMLFGQH
jgi:hypothetical protein